MRAEASSNVEQCHDVLDRRRTDHGIGHHAVQTGIARQRQSVHQLIGHDGGTEGGTQGVEDVGVHPGIY